jgi:tetratricopeptide (TPR) repeat protein
MKKLLIILLVLSSLTAFAKPVTDSTRVLLYRAKNMANAKSPMYNAPKAFAIYNQIAGQGNAEAMNGLGMLYTKGIGTAVNDQQALNWFNKAATGGYAGAYYNLALIYKDGLTTPQDFAKAYDYFSKGAALNNGMCIYGQGYMLYKGYGCIQNYEQAAAFFKRGAALRDEGSYFMLGLAYRNGYGLAVNLDSARYWLKRAAARNDQRAIKELASSSPENLDLQEVPNLQPAPSDQVQTVNLKTGFKQIVQHRLPTDNLDGEYNGYAIKFDWSGKHIIGQSGLKLRLKRKDSTLSGEWKEEGQEGTVVLSGTLTDSAVVFNNTGYNRVDHYHEAKPLAVAFKDSRLNLVQNQDTVYLSGILRLYATDLREPQRPEFMMLIRTGAPSKQHTGRHNDDTDVDSLHFVAYPNPFSTNLSLRYTLKKPTRVSIIVSDVLSGRIVYRSNEQQLAAGDYTNPVNFNGQPGNYIVTLKYGGHNKSVIVYKL